MAQTRSTIKIQHTAASKVTRISGYATRWSGSSGTGYHRLCAEGFSLFTRGRRVELRMTLSHSGKLVHSVYSLLLLFSLFAAAPAVCFARPNSQTTRPRFENNQPHLGEWLQRHEELSPEDQEKALATEPGFDRLPQETRQKLLNRLQQINRMPPRQRQRTVDRIEALEHLTPQRRQQVRDSFQDFHTLAEDRQRMVKKAFRDLREYPPEQRQAMMNSTQFQARFTPRERKILSDILAVEPYRLIRGRGLENGLQYGR
jgi:phage-related protein